ncbi:alpha/beta hydrolase [Mucilaginibacter sp. RS28]|uniref:Alpha/beta hydrolase n=1 Tax=Mucilaginibacter straminoryzae TaxID=2932774 RepID=A0A9X2B9F0_9SPHI|nr:alpha/beta hydrolase [Mucilaginibacter straminoryzae]MCJ8209685.1 alpha/beta hydrolase [Mucilaginibacter straminoryzae]
MEKVYFISGLGADYRLFKNIQLTGYDCMYLNWLEPQSEDTLTSYATKLIETYQISPGSTVIGVSLGGMLTIEIAKQVKLKRAILISSIKTSDEAPFYFKVFRRLPIYKWIPARLMTSVGFMIRPVFGAMASDDLLLFKSMLRNSSPTFVKWAMGAVLHWDSTALLPNVYHITGDKDMVFNYRRIQQPVTIVKDGTHIMVFDKAKIITEWLLEILGK